MGNATFTLDWEAIHDEPGECRGALFDLESGQGHLFYAGAATRKGMLAWQRNEIVRAPEVVSVQIDADEVRWSADLAADADLSGIAPDRIYNALAIRPLRLSATHVICAWLLDGDDWIVSALSREDGTLAWEHPSLEPRRAHVSPDGTRIVIAGEDGPQLVDTATGAVLGGVEGGSTDCVSAIVGACGALVQPEDGSLVFLALDGTLAWRIECGLPLDPDGLVARSVLDEETVILADGSHLRSFDSLSGAERWKLPGFGGAHAALADVGTAVVVQDLNTNQTRLVRRLDGVALDVDGFDRMLHWIPDGGRIVGPGAEGTFCSVDVQAGAFAEVALPESVSLHDVAVGGGRVFATSPGADPDAPPRLLELTREGSGIVASTELPVSLPQVLTVEFGRVVVRSDFGAQVYSAASQG